MPESTIKRIDIDPTTMLLDANVRQNVRLDKDFLASVKLLGVLQPVIAVRTAAGELRVRFGHRRTLAAIEAGLPTIPVDIIGDEATDDAGHIDRIVQQYAENTHRVGLTAVENVEVVAQLSAFGMKPREIAKRTRIKQAHVKAAAAVATSELAKAATARYEFLSLEQAAAVAEFEDDREAAKALITAASSGRFEHQLQWLRNRRDEDALLAQATRALVADGIVVIDPPNWTSGVTSIESLIGGPDDITEESHASCPGHAAYIEVVIDESDESDDVERLVTETTYVCTDPVAYGHIEPWPELTDRSSAPGNDQAASEERRRVVANNKAWRSAETVRREWLGTFLARKSPPKGALPYLAGTLLAGGYALERALGGGNRYARQLLDVDADLGAVTDGRAQVVLLGVVLGAVEATLGVHTWRNGTQTAARYLSALTQWGYEASDIELAVIDTATLGEP
jgi:ParB family transcriptional regulator, chromosome partitioning protein